MNMMRTRLLIIILFLIAEGSCVDRIDIDTGTATNFPIVVDGFISDQPGPYTIKITKSFDIESKQSIKAPISAKRIFLSDDQGTSEQLVELSQGVYQSAPDGIRGEVGHAYMLRIEFLDGRVYESIPDTLYPSGNMEQVYFNFTSEKDKDGATINGFDVFFDSNAGERNTYFFLWKFVATYQVETNPELYAENCGEGKCPLPRPCSSYIYANGELEWVKPCECCTCWISFFNDNPIVSDNRLLEGDHFTRIQAGYVPVNQWTFMHRVHAEVRQMSLSKQAFDFWRAVEAQKQAVNSLFQPVTGKIQSNFVQINGDPGVLEGLFYATAITSESVFINRTDVPSEGMIPPQDLPYPESCVKLFPYSTTEKPDYWN